MAKLKFTSALKRFFPALEETSIQAQSVKEALDLLEVQHPGISGYLLEDDGSLRKHVNIFLKNEMITDRTTLSDKVTEQDEILVYQALSGG